MKKTRGYVHEIIQKFTFKNKNTKGEFVVVISGKKDKKSNILNLNSADNEIKVT